MTTRMWTKTINNDKATEMDSSGVESSWMKIAGIVHGSVPNDVQALLDPQEAWKLWLTMTLDVWRGVIKMGGDPFGVIAGWVKMMEQVQERAYPGEPFSFDFFALFSEWYEATSKPWSKTVEDLIGSERFLAFTDPLLKNYSTLTSTFRDASEAYLKTLRLPTLSDIAGVAELVVKLEEKVDTIEETIECVKKQTTPGAATTIANLEQRLNQIETKLDKTLALLEKRPTMAELLLRDLSL